MTTCMKCGNDMQVCSCACESEGGGRFLGALIVAAMALAFVFMGSVVDSYRTYKAEVIAAVKGGSR